MKNVGASILDRLKTQARASGVAMPALLRRYVQERLLYRLSLSGEAGQFCLKGGMLMAAYNDGDLLRPTEDIDFNGYDGNGDVGMLERTIREVLAVDVADDGVVFLPDTMRILKDRQGVVPGGKVSIEASVGGARVDLKVDVGFGNRITPGAAPMEIPTLLDAFVPRPTILAYPLETVIAEKLHAMAQFGSANTRLKDHFDILMLSRLHEFDGARLAEAIANTFRHQRRDIPEVFSCLGGGYAMGNERAWRAFLGKASPGLEATLEEVVWEIRYFLDPVLMAARGRADPPGCFVPGTGWLAVNGNGVREMGESIDDARIEGPVA